MKPTISFQDFEKLDLRVATILKAEEIEGADKLYKLTLDVGELGQRTICAGIKQNYKPEELEQKQIIIIINLEPRKLRGITSEGMLLAASESENSEQENKENLALLTLDKNMKPGAKIS